MFAKFSYFSSFGHFKAVLVNVADISSVTESDTRVQGLPAVRVKLHDGKEYHAPGTVDAFATALASKKAVADVSVASDAHLTLAEPATV